MRTAKTIPDLRTLAAALPLERVYEFIRERYKHDRFEGRNNPCWGNDYSTVVAQSTLEMLTAHGFGLISKFESRNGSVIYYDATLTEIDLETWRAYVLAELAEDWKKRNAAQASAAHD